MWSSGPKVLGERWGGGPQMVSLLLHNPLKSALQSLQTPPPILFFCFWIHGMVPLPACLSIDCPFKLQGEGSRAAGRRRLAQLSAPVHVRAGSALQPGLVAVVAAAPVNSGCPLRCRCRCAASLPLGSPSGCWSLLGY